MSMIFTITIVYLLAISFGCFSICLYDRKWNFVANTIDVVHYLPLVQSSKHKRDSKKNKSVEIFFMSRKSAVGTIASEFHVTKTCRRLSLNNTNNSIRFSV